MEGNLDIFATYEGGNSLLHLAIENHNFELITNLLEERARVNFKNDEKETPLHIAVKCPNNFDIVNLLISYGADPDSKNIRNETPLDCALRTPNNDEILTLLLSLFNINEDNLNYSVNKKVPIHCAERQFFLHKGDTFCNNDDRSPLHLAVMSNKIKLCELLLNFGASTDVFDIYDKTPLFYAIFNGYEKIAEMLIIRGANVNIKSRKKETALHLAVQYCSKKIVELLIERKADVDFEDCLHRSPLFFAIYHGQEKIVSLLLKYGAKSSFCRTIRDKLKKQVRESSAALHANDVLLKHLIMMRAMGLTGDFSLLNGQMSSALLAYQNECEYDTQLMQQEKICFDRTVTLYDVLTVKFSTLALYFNVDDIREELRNSYYIDTYMIFSDFLQDRFEKALVVKDVYNRFSSNLGRFSALPWICLDKIFNHFSWIDILILNRENDVDKRCI